MIEFRTVFKKTDKILVRTYMVNRKYYSKHVYEQHGRLQVRTSIPGNQDIPQKMTEWTDVPEIREEEIAHEAQSPA